MACPTHAPGKDVNCKRCDTNHLLFKVTPSIAGKVITLDIENGLGATAGFSATLTRKFLDTEDRAIRAALLALGWTPPPEKSEP